ncbi:hypothetical protein [Sporosarcina aquimarina]|uniref:hypothetical protein n=1 Tax=Sporosarcina aquimarina TaxID=114975 RepID=UPI001C8E2701|nr:hypothetical protein [Sporosarcina aquimarina]MBY0223665.1 hypothetical protein [Sporosarcina aquimarina]
MKKLIIFMMTAVLLAACSNEETPDTPETQETPAADKQTNMGMEKGLKAGTTEQDYLSLSQDKVPINSKVKFTGIVLRFEQGTFELKSKTDDSSNEVVWVDDNRLSDRTEIPEGTTVTVYGTYDGKNDDGDPRLKGIFIDAE